MHYRRRLNDLLTLCTWLLLFLLITASPLCADDGYLGDVSGALQLMQGHPSIEMTSERVVIDIYPHCALVDCTFTFKNNGAKTTVKMGFPESGGGEYDDSESPRGIAGFKSWVDGKKITTKVELIKSRKGRIQRWQTKFVSFEKNQIRIIRVSYRAGYGSDITGNYGFYYRLDTGASWKGSIGKVEVIINSHLPKYWSTSYKPSGFKKKDRQIIWEWRNLEPDTETEAEEEDSTSGIAASFYQGYADTIVDGKSTRSNIWPGRLAVIKDGKLWIPETLLGSWFIFQNNDRDNVKLKTPYAILILYTGSTEAKLNDKSITLTHAPYYSWNTQAIMLPAREIIELLGGTVYYDEKSGVTYITTIPKAKIE